MDERSHHGAFPALWRSVLWLSALLVVVWAYAAYSGEATSDPDSGQVAARLRHINIKALRLAVDDLTKTFGDRYPNGKRFEAKLNLSEEDLGRLIDRVSYGDEDARKRAEELLALSSEALLENPLLDFDRLLLIKRGEKKLGLPWNWQGNSSLPTTGYDNEIAILSPIRSAGKLTALYRPEGGQFVGDVDLHFDADRMLFSMPGDNGRWQVFELAVDGTGLRQLPLIEQPDVDNYDPCYLPDGNVLFTSTAPFVGVPCVTGSSHVSNLFHLDCASGKIRQLTFDQDHNWCPTLLPDGRVLYLRWEYSDIPHFASRILFHMNPDGTGQSAYYGSNSYWPNSMFYARPIPGDPTKFVAIISGHHDVPRMGEFILFDAAKGRHEADGVVQRIPGYGKDVKPILRDGLVKNSWPKFLHPYPLSDKYFIVSAKPTADSLWGIYLVDVFDNMTLLKEESGYALLEPVPLRKTRRPPVIPNKVQPGRSDALVLLTDVYAGPGLAGVPRGTVKKLRLLSYHFAYHGMGGQINRIGLDGPWDVKRILGTVPVRADGSAFFRVPANTPISIQPLDAEGKALQLMRSWMTAMPGEVVSCVGCHESPNTSPSTQASLASVAPPSEIEPWYGPARGFSFNREVQPVLDRYCVGCHNGSPEGGGAAIVDLRRGPGVYPGSANKSYDHGTKFPPSYLALRRFVRSPTIESDMHLLPMGEFHADTTQLVQLLDKGHHGVTLDAESWDRLITWIDLHAPAHGTWHEIVGDKKVTHQHERRQAMMKRYAGRDDDPEVILASVQMPVKPVIPKALRKPAAGPSDCATWPFGAEEAKRRQYAEGEAERTVDLGRGCVLHLVRIPSGEFLMGDLDGHPDELPRTHVKVDRPFWMGRVEVTNEQFACFDPAHDSRLERGDYLQFSVEERGYPMNLPRQPVVRISWNQAMAFCGWLTRRTGRRFTLPTEAQWEYACRAGTAEPLWYGQVETDFTSFANLADRSLSHVDTFEPWKLPSGAIPSWRPAVDQLNDHYHVSAPVSSFKPNPWGLYDMHGNVAEWTRSELRPYPYRDDDGRNDVNTRRKRVVRGGSWYDRPKRARSGFRLAYQPYQGVYNVGFRVVCEDEARD